MPQLLNGNEVVTPSEADSKLAKESGRKLAGYLGEAGVRLQMESGDKTDELVLPPTVLRLLAGILAEMGEGNAVTLTPIRAELTTQQAADILNVSRPHLVKLLDQEAMPSRKVGSHRRVHLTDLLAYKREMDEKRHAALDELTALSQELDMGY